MVMSSEVGVYDVEPEKVIQKGRLMPGKIFKDPWSRILIILEIPWDGYDRKKL